MGRHSLRNGLLLVAAVVAGSAGCADTGGPPTVSGSATVNGTRITLTHVVAYSCPAIDDPSKTFVSFLVSDKPVSEQAFRERAPKTSATPMPAHITGAWIALHRYDKAFEGLYFTLGPDGQIATDGILVGDVDAAVSLSQSGVLTSTLKRDGRRLRGQLKTTRDFQKEGTTVGLDVTFDVPVVDFSKK